MELIERLQELLTERRAGVRDRSRHRDGDRGNDGEENTDRQMPSTTLQQQKIFFREIGKSVTQLHKGSTYETHSPQI